MYRYLSFALLCFVFLACDDSAAKKTIANMDMSHPSDTDLSTQDMSDDMEQSPDQMQVQEELPDGLTFAQVHALAEGSEDLYYFALTEKKTVLLETSSDGQGTCPSSLDTMLTLYRYQQGMRVEPLLAKNDDQDTLAGKFCSRIATILEPGIYQVVVGSYHAQAIDQYVLTLSFPKPAQVGETCNGESVCIDASFCDVSSQTCISNAPTIQSATAYYDADRLYLSAEVQDLDLDSGILDQVILIDANGNELGRLEAKLLDLYQSTQFSFIEITQVPDIDLSTVHHIQFTIRDFADHISDPYDVDLLALPILSNQATCMLDRHLGKCEAMNYCQVSMGQIEGLCAPNHAPVIDAQGVVAYQHEIVLVIRAIGSDVENNINRIAVSYFDVNAQPVLINQQAEQIKNIYHQRSDSYYLATVLLDAYSQITSAKVSLIDSGDLRSEAVQVNLQMQPQVAINQACDAYLLENDCGPVICDVQRDASGQPLSENGVCRDIAPQVISAMASKEMNDLFLKISGVDQDRNLRQIGLNALDAQGQVIPFQNSIEPLFFNINLINYDPMTVGSFSASISITNLFVDIPNISSLLVYALDATDYQSIGIEIPIGTRSTVSLNRACDPYRVENICDLGLACENQVCAVPVAPEFLLFSFFAQATTTPTVFFKLKAQIGSSPLSPKAYFIPKDAQGNLVPLIDGQNRFVLSNPVLFEDLGNDTLEMYFSFEHPLADQIKRVEIWMKDINDVMSAHTSSNLLSNIPVLTQNQICDVQQRFGICQQGLSCVDHDMNVQTANRCMP